ncbi:MAG: S8 family serine peptidase [Actinomycetota bacterium]
MLTIDHLHAESPSWQTAYALALCSDLASEPAEAITHVVTESWAFSSCEPFAVGSLRGFVASDTSTCVVSFASALPIVSWITELELKDLRRPYGTVHKGLYHAWETARDQILGALSDRTAQRLYYTGHGVGGAVASIAIADVAWLGLPTATERGTVAAYTFGQPGVGRSDFVHYVAHEMPGDVFRVVMAGDELTHLPPTFRQAGQLLPISTSGEASAPDTETLRTSAWSPDDLTELQEMLTTPSPVYARSQLPRVVDGARIDPIAQASLEALAPGLNYNRLSGYTSVLRRLALQDVFIDGSLDVARQLRSNDTAEYAQAPFSYNEEVTPLLLRLRSADWSPPAGLVVHSQVGTFVTGEGDYSQVASLRSDPNVLSIEASRDAGPWECIDSVPFVRATDVHAPPLAETGSEATVGVIDTGVDVLHEAFLDAEGTSRILAVWDQGGVPDIHWRTPKDLYPEVFTKDYGVLYDGKLISAMVAGALDPPERLRDPGPSSDGTPTPGHGTHVASIAAGRTVGAFAGGVAPDAGIIAVIPRPSIAIDPTHPNPKSIGYSVSHVDALDFLRSAAAAPQIGGGRPIAVNVSQGMNAGAHDGLSTLEAAFDELSQQGRRPGFVIVKSAGNEGDANSHAEVEVMHGGIVEISWSSRNAFRPRDYFEFWYEEWLDLRFELVGPGGEVSAMVSAGKPVVQSDLNGNRCSLRLNQFHPDCGDHQLQLIIVPGDNPIRSGTWRLRIVGDSALARDRIVHGWVERDHSRAVQFLTGDSSASTVTIPGTAKHVITVSACAAAEPLRAPSFSSRGLTRDGRAKPDLCAPGEMVTAAASNSGDSRATVAMPGTSMAAPHVTGAIALAMSRRRKSGRSQLNSNQILSALRRTARHGLGAHHPAFGFGALDVAAFLKVAEDIQ